jgi:HSP20 family protein
MVEVILRPLSKNLNVFVLEQVESLNDERQGWNSSLRHRVWRPPTDVYEIEGAVVVRLEIAGMDEKDFSIILDGKTLLVRGYRMDITERRAYHRMEIRFGEFNSQVELPCGIEIEKIEAVYESGMLRIVLPCAPPKKVDVSVE